MEEKAGNKEKAGIYISSKNRNRNVFLKLGLIASCILAFRALGNKGSVWEGQGLINQKWKKLRYVVKCIFTKTQGKKYLQKEQPVHNEIQTDDLEVNLHQSYAGVI